MAGKWQYDAVGVLTPELEREVEAFQKEQRLSKRGAIACLVRLGLFQLQQQRRERELELRRKDSKPAAWQRFTELTGEKTGGMSEGNERAFADTARTASPTARRLAPANCDEHTTR